LKDPFSLSRTRSVDRGSVYRAYRNWPSLAEKGFQAEFELPDKPFSRAFVLGMGGSAAGGDIIAGWLGTARGRELSVTKGSIPVGQMRGTLAIACSASGKTWETIEMMKTASKGGATIVSISSGGKLREESSRLGVEHIEMPEVVAPRYMLPFIVLSCLAVLNRAFNLRCEEDAREAISRLGDTLRTVDVETAEGRNPAKRLGRKLATKTPVVYGDEMARGVGIRFKNSMNENAKRHASFDLMPELFHNEVEAWEDPAKDFLPIFLRHKWENPILSKKADALIGILRRRGNRPVEVRGEGRGSLSQLLTMTFLLDMASYYTAILLGRDPLSTRTIHRLKKI